MNPVILIKGSKGYFTNVGGKVFFPDDQFVDPRVGYVTACNVVWEESTYGFFTGRIEPTEVITKKDVETDEDADWFSFSCKAGQQYFAVYGKDDDFFIKAKLNGALQYIFNSLSLPGEGRISKADHSFIRYCIAVYRCLRPLAYQL